MSDTDCFNSNQNTEEDHLLTVVDENEDWNGIALNNSDAEKI